MTQKKNWFQEKFDRLPLAQQARVRELLDRYEPATKPKPVTDPAPSASDTFLTLVFKQPLSDNVRALVKEGEWTAASHSHAIWDRDAAERKLKEQALQAKKDALTRQLNEILDSCEEDPALAEALRPQLEALQAKLEGGI